MPPPATTDFTLFLWTGLGVGWQREGRGKMEARVAVHPSATGGSSTRASDGDTMDATRRRMRQWRRAGTLPLSISNRTLGSSIPVPRCRFAGSRRRWASRAVREVPRQRCGQICGATRVCGAGQPSRFAAEPAPLASLSIWPIGWHVLVGWLGGAAALHSRTTL